MRLRSPDKIKQADPLRARYVQMLIHAAGAGSGSKRELAEVLELGVEGSDFSRAFYSSLYDYANYVAHRLQGDCVEVRYDPIDLETKLAGGNFGEACSAMFFLASAAAMRQDVEPSIGMIAKRYGGAGLLVVENDEHPESRWYHELVMLHAFASVAMHSRLPAAMDLLHRAAAFHHAETQPDHATSQPWAIHAFLCDPEFLPTADLMLLAAGVNQPGGLGAVPRILLADAAVCLSLPNVSP